MTSDAVAKLAEAFTDHRKAGFLQVEVSDGRTNFGAPGKFHAIPGRL